MKAKWLLLFLAPVLLALFYKFCCQSTGPIVEIKSRIKSPIAVSFIELSSPTLRNVDQVIKVTFIDPGGKVMSSNGIPLSTLEVTQVMGIGLAPDANFSPASPYVFYIKAESEGYSTDIKPVVVTRDVPAYFPFHMVRLKDLAPTAGLAAAIGSVSNLSGDLMQANDTIVAGTGDQQFRLVLPEGLRFLRRGKPGKINGKLNFQLLRGNPFDSLANLAFPGGFAVFNAQGKDGKTIASPTSPFFFTTAGWFTMTLQDDSGKQFNGFSKPVSVQMPVDNKIMNPQTNSLIKAGDEIPLWSLNDQNGLWRKQGFVTIQDGGGGGLLANFEITHLSTWNLDLFDTGCTFGTGDMEVLYANGDFPGTNYYAEYIREPDGVVLQTNILNLSGGSPLGIIRAEDNGRLYVHQGPDVYSRLRGRSDVLNCGSTGNLALLGSPSFPCVEYELRFIASDGSEVPLCHAPVWYKEGACGGAGYLYNSGSGQVIDPGIVQVFSAGAATECIELRFVGGDADDAGVQVVLRFEIPYADVDNGSLPAVGTAIIGADPAIPFDFNYEITTMPATATCGIRVVVVIDPGAVTGLAACS